MCLTTNKFQIPKIYFKDIEVYKCMEMEFHSQTESIILWSTWYPGKSYYVLDKLYEIPDRFSLLSDFGFYSFNELSDAKHFLIINNNPLKKLTIVKCIIPKFSYYISGFQRIAFLDEVLKARRSKKIIFKEIL